MKHKLSYLCYRHGSARQRPSPAQCSGQAASPISTKSFNPATVPPQRQLNRYDHDSPIPTQCQFTNVLQRHHAAGTGPDLITRTGGTCSTLATGGGIFDQSPPRHFRSRVEWCLPLGPVMHDHREARGVAIGPHINTTSQITANERHLGWLRPNPYCSKQ